MELHPVLDKIFDYSNGGIDQMLKDYDVIELKRIWNYDLPFEVKQQFRDAHYDNDFHTMLRLLCNKSILDIYEESGLEETTDRRR